jgi:hypothetical protein
MRWLRCPLHSLGNNLIPKPSLRTYNVLKTKNLTTKLLLYLPKTTATSGEENIIYKCRLTFHWWSLKCHCTRGDWCKDGKQSLAVNVTKHTYRITLTPLTVTYQLNITNTNNLELCNEENQSHLPWTDIIPLPHTPVWFTPVTSYECR